MMMQWKGDENMLLIALKFLSFSYFRSRVRCASLRSVPSRPVRPRATWMKLSLLFPIFLLLWNCRFTLNWLPTSKRSRLWVVIELCSCTLKSAERQWWYMRRLKRYAGNFILYEHKQIPISFILVSIRVFWPELHTFLAFFEFISTIYKCILISHIA